MKWMLLIIPLLALVILYVLKTRQKEITTEQEQEQIA